MRLRQAHAILEAATALHTAGLGFEIHPLDARWRTGYAQEHR